MNSSKRSRGVTLIEAIVVCIILTIVGVGIAQVQGGLFATQSTMSDMQMRTALIQECAEQILGRRRFTPGTDGYEAISSANFGTNSCGGMTAPSGYTVPTVTLSAYTGSACPSISTCQRAVISSGAMQSIALLLVEY